MESNLVEWIVSCHPVDYTCAVSWMESRVASIANSDSDEVVWLLEHPPIYTAGSRSTPREASDNLPLPLFQTGRGGRVTYHGPGQRIIYLMLDLNRRGRDVRRFVKQSETWIIESLACLGVSAFRYPPHTGVWVNVAGQEQKIAAIGFRIRRWVSFHGISVNVNPDLKHYKHIDPCGIEGKGVSSLAQCAPAISMAELDATLRNQFEACFGSS